MRTLSFLTQLYACARACGFSNPARNLPPERAADLCDWLTTRTAKAWHSAWWPEWTLVERRTYRAAWAAATTYAAPSLTVPVEVWHPGAEQYAQALRTSTGQAPFTFSDPDWEANYAYWYPCNDTYAGDDWAASTDYTGGTLGTAGTVVRNPGDGRFYACHTTHTSGATFDATKFGVLTPLNRYIAWEQAGETKIGAVRMLSTRDPWVYPAHFGQVGHNPVSEGIQAGADAPEQPYVTFRKPAPRFTTTAYSASTAYAVGALVYYATTQECYECIAASTNHAPTDTAYWERQPFPLAISDAVIAAVKADWLAEQNQHARAQIQLGNAFNDLADAHDRELDAQAAEQRPVVRGFGR